MRISDWSSDVCSSDLVAAKPLRNLKIGARAKVEIHNVDSPLAKPMRNIFARNHQIGAAIILAAQHDMGVRMAGVEMVHRHPIEFGPEILFHLRHQSDRKSTRLNSSH